jgi:hypothetical protein
LGWPGGLLLGCSAGLLLGCSAGLLLGYSGQVSLFQVILSFLFFFSIILFSGFYFIV